MHIMPDNAYPEPLRFFQPGGETYYLRFLSEDPQDTVDLRGIGTFEVGEVALDDRYDLHRLIEERHGDVDRFLNSTLPPGALWDYVWEVQPQEPPVCTRESLMQAIEEIRERPPQPDVWTYYRYHPIAIPPTIEEYPAEALSRPQLRAYLEEMMESYLTVGDHPAPSDDPEVEFSPSEERHFATAKERLDSWMQRSGDLLDEMDEPVTSGEFWELDAYSHCPELDEPPQGL